MVQPLRIRSETARYRLVGVITVGITRLPIISFGYQMDKSQSPEFKDSIHKTLSEHTLGAVDLDLQLSEHDRVTWRAQKGDDANPCTLFDAMLELPVKSGEDCVGTHLFARTAREESGFAVALTFNDTTLVSFYDLKTLWKDQDSERTVRLRGELSKFVAGPVVPLLRNIETLLSQKSPQRRISVPDEELGIIYKVLSGHL